MDTNGVIATSGFLAVGLVAGHAGRRLLARLRRGAVFRSPCCELFAAMASAVVGWRLAVGALPVWWFAVPLLLSWLAVPLAAVDLLARRLPNALTYAAYPILGIALTVAAAYGPDQALAIRALVGGALFGGAHLAVRRVAPRSLGAGDAKLAGGLGAVLGALGWQALILATALAATITLLLALTPLAHPNPALKPEPNPKELPAPKPTPMPAPARLPAPTPPAPTPPTPTRLGPTPVTSSPALTRAPWPDTLAPLAEPARKETPSAPADPVPAHPALPPPTSPLSPARAHPTRAQPTEVLPAVTDPLPSPSTSSPPEGSPAIRTALLRRAVPHGPGLLVATWLLATFPGHALIGGVAG